MLRFIAVIILVLFPVIAHAEWNSGDTAREIVWQGLHVVDWGQTLEIARNPIDYHEVNPVIGRHPSVGKVNIYMLSSAIIHAGISYVLPDKVRPYWQYFSIGVSGACMARNLNIGLGVRF